MLFATGEALDNDVRDMAITIFVHRTHPDVAIVRWFRDWRGNIDFASGPLIRMPLDEFRATGYDLVRNHFAEYVRIRLPENKVVKVFQPGEARKVMKDRSVVDICRDPGGNLIFSPRSIRRYDLAALEGLGEGSRRTISEGSAPDLFWKTFDEVLAMASEA